MFKKISYLTSSLVCASFFSTSTSSYAALDCNTVCQEDVCGASPRIVEACRQQCGRNPVMKSCMAGARKSQSQPVAPAQDALEGGGFGNMFNEPQQPAPEEISGAPLPAPISPENHSSEVCIGNPAIHKSVQQAIHILQGIQSCSSQAPVNPEMAPPLPAPTEMMAPPPPPPLPVRQTRKPAMQRSMQYESGNFAEQLQNRRTGLRPTQPNQRPETGVNNNHLTRQLQERRAGLRPTQQNQYPETGVNNNHLTKQLQERRAGLRPTQPTPRPLMNMGENSPVVDDQNGRDVPAPPPPPQNQRPTRAGNQGNFAEQLQKGRQNLRQPPPTGSPEIFHNQESKSPLDSLGRTLTKGIGGMTGRGQN